MLSVISRFLPNETVTQSGSRYVVALVTDMEPVRQLVWRPFHHGKPMCEGRGGGGGGLQTWSQGRFVEPGLICV
jgi:hypothetical protein